MSSPQSIEGDRIIPMHLFDDVPANNTMILSITLCFDSVLIPEIVHSSLVRLLNIGEWRKLGGRLHRNMNSKLEIHIHENLCKERPAVNYYHENFDCKIKDHPIASQLPRPGSLAKTTNSIGKICEPLTYPPGGPQNLEDYVSRDEPQLSLRINSFRDTTLVSLNFLHNLTDVQGLAVLLKAWSDMMAGREDQIPDKIGAYEDVIAKFGSAIPREELHFADNLAGLEVNAPASTSVWEGMFNAKNQAKDIFVPKRVIEKIRQTAIEELKRQGFPPEAALKSNPNKPFLSEGDILVSWLTKHALAGHAPLTPQPVTIINIIDSRDRVPQAFNFSGRSSVYVGNATLHGHVYVPSYLVAEAPLSELAASARTQLVKQTTPEQIQARIAFECRSLTEEKGEGDSFIHASSAVIFFTNWSKAKFYDIVDFTAAVVPEDTANERSSNPGLISYFHSQAMNVGDLPLNFFQIAAKDRDGNYWILGRMTVEAWESFEKDLEILNNAAS